MKKITLKKLLNNPKQMRGHIFEDERGKFYRILEASCHRGTKYVTAIIYDDRPILKTTLIPLRDAAKYKYRGRFPMEFWQ